MISFRYHLVSIIAVFLALVLGIVMGTTVIKQGVITSLRMSVEAAPIAMRTPISDVRRLTAYAITP